MSCQPMRTLLVEDSKTAQKLLANKIRAIGYSIDIVETLDEAKQMMHEYDVVLLDLNLPDSTGVGTIQEMKNGAALIVITEMVDDGDQCRAYLNAGADFVLPKNDAFRCSTVLLESILELGRKRKRKINEHKAWKGRLEEKAKTYGY